MAPLYLITVPHLRGNSKKIARLSCPGVLVKNAHLPRRGRGDAAQLAPDDLVPLGAMLAHLSTPVLVLVRRLRLLDPGHLEPLGDEAVGEAAVRDLREAGVSEFSLYQDSTTVNVNFFSMS